MNCAVGDRWGERWRVSERDGERDTKCSEHAQSDAVLRLRGGLFN